MLAGPVSGVYAEMHYRSEHGGLDDDFFIALTHEGGVRSHLWGSRAVLGAARTSARTGQVVRPARTT